MRKLTSMHDFQLTFYFSNNNNYNNNHVNSFHRRQVKKFEKLSRRHVQIYTKLSKNVNIFEVHDHIWNHHGKCIKISTNMPGIGLEICGILGILRNITILYRCGNQCRLEQHHRLCTEENRSLKLQQRHARSGSRDPHIK